MLEPCSAYDDLGLSRTCCCLFLQGRGLAIEDRVRLECHLELHSVHLHRPVQALLLIQLHLPYLRPVCLEHYHQCNRDDRCGEGRNGHRDAVLHKAVRVATF